VDSLSWTPSPDNPLATYSLYHTSVTLSGADTPTLVYSGSALSFTYTPTALERAYGQIYQVVASNNCSTVSSGLVTVPATAEWRQDCVGDPASWRQDCVGDPASWRQDCGGSIPTWREETGG
jgi:hypothetical protein